MHVMHMLTLHVEKSRKNPEQLPVPAHQHDPSNSSVLALITKTLQGGTLTKGGLGHAGDTTPVQYNSVLKGHALWKGNCRAWSPSLHACESAWAQPQQPLSNFRVRGRIEKHSKCSG